MKTKAFRILLILLSFLCGFLLIVKNKPTFTPKDKIYGDAYKSFEWWYAQRALPFEMIPKGAFEKAVKYTRTKINKERKISQGGFDVPPWSSLGPYNIGGRILALAIDPINPNIIWAGSASGGLWKSTTGGIGTDAWNYINTGFNTLSVSAIAIDPTSSNTLFIGTGEISLYHRPLIGTPGARASYGMGILKTTDGGISWVQTGLTWTFPEITAVQKIVINPLNTKTIYAATSEGVFKSLDAGNTWTISNPILMAMDIVIDPSDTSVLYVSHGNLNSSPNPGLYKTTNAGESWIKLISGLPFTDFGRTALSISPINPSIIYAGISNASSGGMLGLYKSTNAGTSWLQVNTTNYVGVQGWYDNVIAVHPNNPDSLYCAGLNIYQSIDGGITLNDISGNVVHVDHHAIAFHPFNPNIVYFGTDGGVFKTTNGGASFLNCNYGLQTTQFYPGFANSIQDSTIAIGGLQDNGTLKYTGSKYWWDIFINDGGWCAIDPTNKDIMYFEYQYLNLYKSTNGGNGFFPIMNGLPNGSANTNFIAPFVMAPSSPNILYAGAKTVYKTTNGGNLWFSPNGQTTLNGTSIACIGVSPTNANHVIAGTGTGTLGASPIFEIFATGNGGNSWQNVTYNLNGVDSLPNRYPTDIEFDPTNDMTAYLTYSGYGTPHLFKTTNLGETWTSISSNLPDIPHQAICVDPEAPENLYVGTDLGIFHSSDYGSSWEEFNNGMPPAMVLDLTISPMNKKLRASTFGNGVFERKLFRIPQLTLITPNGGEKWIADFVETIQWSQKFIDKIKIEYTTNNGIDWFLIDDNVPAILGTYSWHTPPIATEMARIKVSNIIDGIPVDSSETTFSLIMNPDFYHGWNLISLHLKVQDPSINILFPSAISKAFKYEKTYLSVDTLTNGVGYWLKFPDPEFIKFNGDSIVSDTIDVKSGWNLIGSISKPITIDDIMEIPSGIVKSRYFGYKLGYQAIDTIQPGKGYWVKVNSDGKLILDASMSLNKITFYYEAPCRKFNSITFRDNEGNNQKLYITKEKEIDFEKFELPPLPPDGLFDVRFNSQRNIEIIPTKLDGQIEHKINIQMQNYPLTITWDILDDDYAFSIMVGGNIIPIRNIGEIKINQESHNIKLNINSLKRTSTPNIFTLDQNYPNPFNPKTTIKYQIPTDGWVKLTLYDIQGKEITTLVNEKQSAGIKTVEWTPDGVASGVYYYNLYFYNGEMSINKYSITKKLIIIK